MTKYENLFEKEILQQLDDCEVHDARLHFLEQEIKDQRTCNEIKSKELHDVLQRLRRSKLRNPIYYGSYSLPGQAFLEPDTEQAD